MSIDNQQQDIPFVGTQYGLIGGVLLIIILLAAYIINPDMLSNISMFLFIQLAVVGIMIIAANVARQQNAGYIDFKGALKNAFGAAVLALLIFVVFYYILYKFIDPNLIVLYKKKSIERVTEYMQKGGSSEKQIREVVSGMEAQDFAPSIKYSSMIYAGYLIVSFFYALIIGAVFNFAFKGNKPMPNTQPLENHLTDKNA